MIAKYITISGPSGVGKTTIINSFLKKYNPKAQLAIYDITREKRNNEIEGLDYYFINESEFKEKVKRDNYLIYYNLLGSSRGLLKSEIEKITKKGFIPLIIIDYANLYKLQKKVGENNIMSIFISVDDKNIIINRLKKRYIFEKDNYEVEKEFQARIKYIDYFLDTEKYYKHIIKNEIIENSVDELYKLYNNFIKKS